MRLKIFLWILPEILTLFIFLKYYTYLRLHKLAHWVSLSLGNMLMGAVSTWLSSCVDEVECQQTIKIKYLNIKK